MLLDDASGPLIPPAPPSQTRPLKGLALIRAMRTSMLSIWGDRAYDFLIIKGRSFGRDLVVVNDPAMIRRVLVENAANYPKHINVARLTRPIVGDGVLLSEGPEWKRQRRMLSPAFTPAHVERLVPHFAEAARGLISRTRGQERVNLSQALQETALDAAARSMFSMPIGGRGARLAELARGYGAGPGRPTLFDAIARKEGDFAWFVPGRPRFRRMWRKQIDAIVSERRSRPRPDGEQDDFLDLLFKARDPETGEGMEDAEIRDQTSTMLTAGFETTARALFWTLYLLALDQPEQALIRAELEADPPGEAPVDAARRWPRLRRAILESMRLYPPAPILIRTALEADVLGAVEVPKGATVLISPWIVHRHRKLWERPEAFLPDRFEGKANEYQSGGAYIPFGGGPRICIGAAFAMTEATVVLALFLQRFEVSLDDSRPVTPMSAITTYPSHEPWFRLHPAG